ncbi:MAG: NTP transferase domain-containing protein [Flavobacteriales bacterium]
MGKFARNEVAIMGTTCEAIAQWARLLTQAFAPSQVVYVDANHNPSDASDFLPRWTDNQHAIAVELKGTSEIISRHIALSQSDLVIVNGNHFEAANQIILCDPSKEASLRKRASQLTNVLAIITTHGCQSVPEYIKEILPNWTDIPVLNEQNIHELTPIIRYQIMKPAPLKALILTGGKSVRMGKDKPHIHYHGKAQFAHLYELCKDMGIEPFLSCRAEQREYFEEQGYKTIADRLLDMGPLGGITAAFMTDPNAAWLVLASDVPFLDNEILNELIKQRSTIHTATAFQSPFDRFPEPLIAIWEPKAFPMIMSFIALGYSCPRKVLIQTEAHIIVASSPEKLENVNTPDELDDAMQTLKKS